MQIYIYFVKSCTCICTFVCACVCVYIYRIQHENENQRWPFLKKEPSYPSPEQNSDCASRSVSPGAARFLAQLDLRTSESEDSRCYKSTDYRNNCLCPYGSLCRLNKFAGDPKFRKPPYGCPGRETAAGCGPLHVHAPIEHNAKHAARCLRAKINFSSV